MRPYRLTRSRCVRARRRLRLAATFVVGVVASVTASVTAPRAIFAQQVGSAPLEIRVLDAPTPLRALGRLHLVHEVHLTNFGARAVSIAQLDAVGDSVLLETYTGVRLRQRLVTLGQAPAMSATDLVLEPGQRAIAYLWVSLGVAAASPRTVQQRVVVRDNALAVDTVMSASVLVHAEYSPLDAPAGRGTWVAIRGPSNTSGHRRSFVAMGGDARVPQRFAVDWAMLGDDGRLFHGDSTIAANWYGFGQSVIAVASGSMVYAVDSIPDRAAFVVSSVPVMRAREATGNAVVVAMDGGRFATFAHLKRGSVRVKVGDRVIAGQVLGAVGNSGNTLGPHLHFHVSRAPALLASEGRPFVLREFALVGRVNSLASLLAGTPWQPVAAQPARTVTRESPLENIIVRFAR